MTSITLAIDNTDHFSGEFELWGIPA